MKNILFATAGLAALLMAAPAQAQEGYVGGSYVSQQFDPGNTDADGWQIDGAVALDTGSSLGVAIDAAVGDTDLSDTVVSVGGHLFGNSTDALFGGFVDYTDGGNNSSAWTLGGEGQFNFTGFTLAGSLGWVNLDSGAYEDGWGGGVEARVFPTDNLRLSGNLGYADLNGTIPAFDDSVWTFGVGGEWQPASLPVSLVADYAHSEFDRANGEADAFRIGARYNFGGSLKARSDSGADLPGAKFLGGIF